MTERCTLRGRMISSPRPTTDSTIACTLEVVPPTIRKACAAPKASAASSSASRMTLTGWHRLSSGFMELTSTVMHCSPRNRVSSGLPRPRLCPGTSNGTMRISLNRSSASLIGARDWSISRYLLLQNKRNFARSAHQIGNCGSPQFPSKPRACISVLIQESKFVCRVCGAQICAKDASEHGFGASTRSEL